MRHLHVRASTLLLVALLLHPANVAAQRALVGEGVRQFEEADLESALATFERAEAASDLTTEDLATLYATRALVHRALGDTASFEADLRRLAVVDPTHAFDASVPPDVGEVFVRVRADTGAVQLSASAERSASGVTVRAAAEGDTESMIREVRVHARADDAPWQNAVDAVELPGAPELVQYYAEAQGPGGAILANEGSRDAPLERRFEESDSAGGAAFPWLWLGVGAAVLAAGTVVAIALASGGDDTIQPTLPMRAGLSGGP